MTDICIPRATFTAENLQFVEKAAELVDSSWILRKHNGACRIITADGTDSDTICEEKQFEDKPKKPVCEFGKHLKNEKKFGLLVVIQVLNVHLGL